MYKNKKRFYPKKSHKSNHSFLKPISSSKFVNKSPEKKVVYVSQNDFNNFNIENLLKRKIERKGYKTPTEIQDKAIPLILQGNDVIGIANTGTGKTAAFLLPLIDKVLKNKNERIFIVTPTRELAFQINEELISLTQSTGVYSVVCIGGSNMFMQIKKIRSKPHFVIGTPGRLKDLVNRKHLSLRTFTNIVIDEADRMLDMGFINDIRFLMNELSDNRQTLLFSATLSPEIEKIIKAFLKNPIKISVKVRETAENVDQDVIRAKGEKEKLEKLSQLLKKKSEFQKVLIFGKTKRGVERLSRDLNRQGFSVVSIHGDKTQSKRQQALNLFKKGLVQTLVATDVAARGLDINNVSHVINFDIPATYDDYIHRIGRTGRADKTGIALTFIG